MAWFQAGIALLTERLPWSRPTDNALFVGLLHGKETINPLSVGFTKLLKTRHADSERDS
jgi:hypothetical protein